jgi:Na+-transporting methylmalonyl-CoA/oxaloacetate decarboxylase gamma subunit
LSQKTSNRTFGYPVFDQESHLPGPFPTLHPLQALSYIVGVVTAVGALYLGIMTFRAGRRDKAKDAKDREKVERIEEASKNIEAALKAAEQAQFIKSLQEQIIDLEEELQLVKQRQRRGMGVQFTSAVVFLALLVGLFFYEGSINERIRSASTQAQSAADTANNANKASDNAVKQVDAANLHNHSKQASTLKKKASAKASPE